MIDYSLYLVTDDPSRYEMNWLDNVVSAVEGGVTCVQYRDTESLVPDRLSRIRQLLDALSHRKTPVVVNNDVELAHAVRAAGVHVGQSDMPPAQARALLGHGFEIGLSITDIRQLARVADADCLGIGPVFDARMTKADASDAMGCACLAAVVRASRLPTVAIGGITLENAPEVLATGVSGLALVSAFSKSPDPYVTARAFRRLLP